MSPGLSAPNRAFRVCVTEAGISSPANTASQSKEVRASLVERQMDDAVRSRCPCLQAIRIVDRSAVDLGAGGRERRSLVGRTAEADHLMARSDQLVDDSRADLPRGAGDKHTHKQRLRVSLETSFRFCDILVK